MQNVQISHTPLHVMSCPVPHACELLEITDKPIHLTGLSVLDGNILLNRGACYKAPIAELIA